jgi:hypothetical protein
VRSIRFLWLGMDPLRLIRGRQLLGLTHVGVNRAAIWRQNHPDFTPCRHCPSCTLLPAISKLLKVASHPYLLKEYRQNIEAGNQSKAYEFACTALTDSHLVDLGGPIFSSSILSGSRIEMSGKMKALDRLLSHFSANFDKVCEPVLGR